MLKMDLSIYHSHKTDLFNAHVILLDGIFRDFISQHHEVKRITDWKTLIFI